MKQFEERAAKELAVQAAETAKADRMSSGNMKLHRDAVNETQQQQVQE